MKHSKNIIFFGILLVTFISSCGTKPRAVIAEKKMTELLTDMYKAEAITKKDSKLSSDEQKGALVDAVFSKHKVTREQFEKSLDWYAENIDLYNSMLDTISARLQREYTIDSEEIKEVYKFKLSGFTTDLPQYYVLDNSNPTFRFRIDSLKMKSFQPENFQFSFNTQGVDTAFYKMSAAVYFKYSDTTIVDRQEIAVDSLYNFVKPVRSDSLLKEISGYVHLQLSDKTVPRVILSNILNKSIVEEINKSDSINVSEGDEPKIGNK